MKIRLQKIIANAGLGSRREAERWIADGKVSVNGKVVDELGVLADPEKDNVQVRGRRAPPPQKAVHLIFNKPARCITTTRDDSERPTVMDYLKKVPGRVFPVGRLDYNTQGLLLLTNDGELAEKLLSPKCGVKRLYEVKVRGVVEKKALGRLTRGVYLDKRPTAPVEATLIRQSGKNTFLSMTLVEGKNRHIRRICEKIGHPVVKLRRVGFGCLSLDDLPLGSFRYLSPREVRKLRALTS